jgi:hypothetical protein
VKASNAAGREIHRIASYNGLGPPGCLHLIRRNLKAIERLPIEGGAKPRHLGISAIAHRSNDPIDDRSGVEFLPEDVQDPLPNARRKHRILGWATPKNSSSSFLDVAEDA